MIYHVSTKYDVSSNDKETEFADLTSEQKEKYTTYLKWDTMESNASNYAATNYKALIYKNLNDENKDNDLRIYDPVAEYRFYNSYSDVYTLMDKSYFKDNLIFSYDGIEYSCEDFYKEASLYYASETITNYFQLEYANSFFDKYIDEDTKKTNSDTVKDAISTFNSNGNSQYPSSMGLANYLLIAYGYENEEDVLK